MFFLTQSIRRISVLTFLALMLLISPVNAESSSDLEAKNCIAADDFGASKTVRVSSFFPKGSSEFIANDKESSDKKDSRQVIRWKKSGYITNGGQIVLRTTGKWTDWENGEFGDNEEQKAQRICGPFSKANFKACSINGSCEYISANNPKEEPEKGQYNAPCWFNNGYGAYLLLRRPQDPDPNLTLELMRNPKSPIIHIGYKSIEEGGDGVFRTKNAKVLDESCNEIDIGYGWIIYTKISSKYYWDNEGGYNIKFLQGAQKENYNKIFEKLREIIDERLDKASKAVFEGILGNSMYVQLVRVVLCLFVILMGISYMMGLIQSHFSDFMVRLIKVSSVITLLYPDSWWFLYNIFNGIFVDIVHSLIGLINSHSGVSFRPEAPFQFIDEILAIIFGPNTFKKIIALMWSSPIGFVIVVFLVFVLLYYFIVIAFSLVTYFTAQIGMAILSIMIPFIFLLLLFGKTKEIFNNWLKVAISFSMQAIIIFTLVSLFSSLIMRYFYRTLGFTVCENEVVRVSLGCINDKCIIDRGIYTWSPGQKFSTIVIGQTTTKTRNKEDQMDDLKEEYSSNSRYLFTGGIEYIPVPPEYKVNEYRYVDLPFFSTAGVKGVVKKDKHNFDHEYSDLLDSLWTDSNTPSYLLYRKIDQALNLSQGITDSDTRYYLNNLLDYLRKEVGNDLNFARNTMKSLYTNLLNNDFKFNNLDKCIIDTIVNSITYTTFNQNCYLNAQIATYNNTFAKLENILKRNDLFNQTEEEIDKIKEKLLSNIQSIKNNNNIYQNKQNLIDLKNMLESLHQTVEKKELKQDIFKMIQDIQKNESFYELDSIIKTNVNDSEVIRRDVKKIIESEWYSNKSDTSFLHDIDDSSFDALRLKQIMLDNNVFSGLTAWDELLLLILISYIIWMMKLFVQRVAASISGGSPFLNVIGTSFANIFTDDGRSLFGKLGQLVQGVYQTPFQLPAMKIFNPIYNKVNRSTPSAITGIIDTMTPSVMRQKNYSIEESIHDHEMRHLRFGQAVLGYHLLGVGNTIKYSGLNLLKSKVSHEFDMLGRDNKHKISYLNSQKIQYNKTIGNLNEMMIGYKQPKSYSKIPKENKYDSTIDMHQKQKKYNPFSNYYSQPYNINTNTNTTSAEQMDQQDNKRKKTTRRRKSTKD